MLRDWTEPAAHDLGDFKERQLWLTIEEFKNLNSPVV